MKLFLEYPTIPEALEKDAEKMFTYHNVRDWRRHFHATTVIEMGRALGLPFKVALAYAGWNSRTQLIMWERRRKRLAQMQHPALDTFKRAIVEDLKRFWLVRNMKHHGIALLSYPPGTEAAFRAAGFDVFDVRKILAEYFEELGYPGLTPDNFSPSNPVGKLLLAIAELDKATIPFVEDRAADYVRTMQEPFVLLRAEDEPYSEAIPIVGTLKVEIGSWPFELKKPLRPSTLDRSVEEIAAEFFGAIQLARRMGYAKVPRH